MTCIWWCNNMQQTVCCECNSEDVQYIHCKEGSSCNVCCSFLIRHHTVQSNRIKCWPSSWQSWAVLQWRPRCLGSRAASPRHGSEAHQRTRSTVSESHCSSYSGSANSATPCCEGAPHNYYSLLLFMVALWNRADHYIFILWFLLSFILSSPNLSGWRLDVCHTSTHSVALVRI